MIAAGPLVFVAAAAVYAWQRWESLPDRIVVHWGLSGADRWVERTPSSVAVFLGALGGFCLTSALLAYGISNWSRRIHVSGERAKNESAFRKLSLILLLGMPYLVVIPAILFSFAPNLATAQFWPVIGVSIGLVAIVALFVMGQGGSRLETSTETDVPVGDHTPDSAWKLGLFYYNPDDPALVVEKRFGIGYTFNMARPAAWLLLGVMLAPIVLIAVLR